MIATATATSLLIAEGVLRLAGISIPNFHQPDPVLGASLRPNAEGWWTKEGKAFVRINASGRRDVDRPKTKPPGTFRIAVLGDSYAEALQVPYEKSISGVLESELNGRPPAPGTRFEVFNFGVSGYGTAQEFLTFRHRALDYDPDLAILLITTGNDIRNNSPELEGDRSRPFFRLVDGTLVLDDSRIVRSRPAWLRALRYHQWINHCRLLQITAAAMHGMRGQKMPLSLDWTVYRPPEDARWEEAWAVTEALITRTHREAQEKEIRFLAVTLSNDIQAHPSPDVRRAFMDETGIQDLFYPDRRVADHCNRNGIPSLALAPVFQAHAEEKNAFLHGFENTRWGYGHWNVQGHLLAGTTIAEAVRSVFHAK